MSIQPLTIFSESLNRRLTCYVYLPGGYEEDETKRYPVVYLLHGRSGSESDWVYKGNAEETIEKMRASNELRDAIVVMPSDGGYDRGTFYVDWYDGSGNYEQYFMYDLVPFIDQQFRTIDSYHGRVIGGFSMGGYGAFMLALRHPETFGAAASISGALLKTEDFPNYERCRLLGSVNGPHSQKYDLRHLVRESKEWSVRPELYFNCGQDDYLLPGNRDFHTFLEQMEYRHFYEEFPGEHDWTYAGAHFVHILTFFEKYFRAHLEKELEVKS